MIILSPSKGKQQKMKSKICMFPGCSDAFVGRGKAKYCDEHRKSKYRKELYKRNDNTGDGIVIIDHKECYAKKISLTCELNGCDHEYDVVLIPRLFEYPSFCEEHRNEFKRQMFIEKCVLLES